jgi:hypothetical protein
MLEESQNSPIGGEDECVDDVASLETVQVLALVQVPEHGDTVLSTGSAERTIWGDGYGGDVSGVSEVVGAQLALAELPDLMKEIAFGSATDSRMIHNI